MELHRVGCSGLLPDLTVLIEIEPGEAAMRLERRDGEQRDAIGGRGEDYHRQVAEAFARIADSEAERFVRVPGNGSPQETAAAVWAAVAPLLPARR